MKESARSIKMENQKKSKVNLRKKDKLPPELDKLADGVGKFIEYWGFKSIHGRVWTLLYLSKNPMSAIEISRKLKVSKTLLSFSIAELLKFNVILEAGRGEKRTVYFTVNPNITEVILNVLRKREKPMLGEIYSNYERVKQLAHQIDPTFKLEMDRLKKMGEFILSAQEVLQSLILNTEPDCELIAQFFLIASVLAGNHSKSSGE